MREKQRANSPRARKHPGDPKHHFSPSLASSHLHFSSLNHKYFMHYTFTFFTSIPRFRFYLKKRRQYPQYLRARRTWCVWGTEEDLCEELRARGRWAPKVRGRGLGAKTASDWLVWRVSCREGISGVGGCKHWIYILRRRNGFKLSLGFWNVPIPLTIINLTGFKIEQLCGCSRRIFRREGTMTLAAIGMRDVVAVSPLVTRSYVTARQIWNFKLAHQLIGQTSNWW